MIFDIEKEPVSLEYLKRERQYLTKKIDETGNQRQKSCLITAAAVILLILVVALIENDTLELGCFVLMYVLLVRYALLESRDDEQKTDLIRRRVKPRPSRAEI